MCSCVFQRIRKGSGMKTGTMTIGGNLFRAISFDEENDMAVAEMVIPPAKGPNYQNTPHRHPSAEPVDVLSGLAEVRHGFDLDHLMVEVLKPGQRLVLQSNEWHAIKNLSPQEELVVSLGHSPMGKRWHEFVTGGVAATVDGRLPAGYVSTWFDRLGLEFVNTH